MKRESKGTWIKKTAALALSVVLTAGMMPAAEVRAENGRNGQESGKVYELNLGISALQAPENTGDGADSKWSGSRVYLGGTASKQASQYLWKVLALPEAEKSGQGSLTGQQSGNGAGSTAGKGAYGQKGILLLADSGISTGALPDSSFLNGGSDGKDGFLKGFDANEINAILTSGKKAAEDTVIDNAASENGNTAGTAATGTTVYTNPEVSTGTKVFLLSAEEVLNKEYGFVTDASRQVVSSGDSKNGTSAAGNSQSTASGLAGTKAAELQTTDWWLRSKVKGEDTLAAVVDKNGRLSSLETTIADSNENSNGTGTQNQAGGQSKNGTDQAAIVPALYLDSEAVVFTTPAGVQKATALSAIKEVNLSQTSKNTENITLLDQSKNAPKDGLSAKATGDKVSEDGAYIYDRGSVICVEHKKASEVLSGATQVSALILDADGNAVYYGRVSEDVNSTGTRITLPEAMAAGVYRLYVFAEDVNEGNETDYASALGKSIALKIPAKLTPVVRTLPTAEAITYGQSLSESVLSGGNANWSSDPAKFGLKAVEGSFAWKDGTLKPTVADSGVTEYEVVFTPAEESIYYPVSVKVKLTVNPAQIPGEVPQSAITVGYETEKVSQVPLPTGWRWKAEDSEKTLNIGGSLQATALYQDIANYKDASRIITIIRSACTHKGGTATCTKQAICEICGQPYGTLDPNKHGKTIVQGAKEATCTEEGYTGDTVCQDCNTILSKGTAIAALGHTFTEQVKEEATVDKEGLKAFTCTRCGYQYTEAIPRHTHYYYQTKTIHWVGCVQQGEVEHICGCGDSYIEITPALGHDYEVKVTKKATATQDGEKTYTCKRCGYVYTEAIPKTGGGSSNTDTTPSDTVKEPVSERMPYVKNNTNISGWNSINKHILKAAEGAQIQINMNESMILPGRTLENLKGKNITLLLDMGNNMAWMINGQNISAEKPSDINLKVTKNSGAIPGGAVANVAGERESLQFSLAMEKDPEAVLTLSLPLDTAKAGQYGNLFRYDTASGKLEYAESPMIVAGGSADFAISRMGDYVVIYDAQVVDGNSPVPDTPTPSESVEPSEPEPSKDTADASSDQTKSGLSFEVIMTIIVGLAVLGTSLILIVVLRSLSRRRHEMDGSMAASDDNAMDPVDNWSDNGDDYGDGEDGYQNDDDTQGQQDYRE